MYGPRHQRTLSAHLKARWERSRNRGWSSLLLSSSLLPWQSTFCCPSSPTKLLKLVVNSEFFKIFLHFNEESPVHAFSNPFHASGVARCRSLSPKAL